MENTADDGSSFVNMTTVIKRNTWTKYSLRSLLLTLLPIALVCFLLKVFYFNRPIPYVPKSGDRVFIHAETASPEWSGLKSQTVEIESELPNEPRVVYYSIRGPNQSHILQNIQISINNDLFPYEYRLMPNSPVRDTLEKRHLKLIQLVEQKHDLDKISNSTRKRIGDHIESLENQLSAFPLPADHSTIGYLRGTAEAIAFEACGDVVRPLVFSHELKSFLRKELLNP